MKGLGGGGGGGGRGQIAPPPPGKNTFKKPSLTRVKNTINPMCSCGFESETIDYYLLHYKLYTDLRLDLLNDIYIYIP